MDIAMQPIEANKDQSLLLTMATERSFTAEPTGGWRLAGVRLEEIVDAVPFGGMKSMMFG